MAEPVTTTAAAGAAAVAAPAAGAATPAAAAAPGAAIPAGGAAASPGAAGGLSPASALKMVANGLDSVASLPAPRPDPGRFTSTIECHTGSGQAATTEPQTSGMPNLESPLTRAFLEPVHHGLGTEDARQPLQPEMPRDPSGWERALDDHGLRGSGLRESSPDRRADAPSPNPQAPGATIEPSAPAPEVRASASTPEGRPPGEAPAVNPRPDDRASAAKAGTEPHGPPEAEKPPTSHERARSDQPSFERKTQASLEGTAGGFFGSSVPDVMDLAVRLLSMSDAWRPWLEDMQPERANQEFRDFGEAASRSAADKDEVFGTAGTFLGAVGPDVISPSSKGNAVKKTAEKLLKAKAAKTTIEITKKRADDAAAKRAARKAAEKAALAVEKSITYRELERRGLVYTQPIKESRGAWFQRWLSKKQHEYVGRLKNGVTVQIDDFAVGADGKLVIIEAKFMKPGIEIPESGHTKFAAEKIGHIKRLLKFARENQDIVSHIEFTVSRTEAAAIYADIIVNSIRENVIGPLITFGKP